MTPGLESCCKFQIIVKKREFKVGFREEVNRKKRFLSGIARMMGGGLPMPEFFGPLSRSAFLVNKKGLFLQKCIELLTVF